MRTKALLLGLTLLAQSTQVQAITLTWEWPHALGTPTWQLLLVRTTNQDTAQEPRILTALTPEDCAKALHPTPYDRTQSWCATLDCPGAGAYSLLLQADESLPSNVITFGLDADCHSIPYEQAIATAIPIERRGTASATTGVVQRETTPENDEKNQETVEASSPPASPPVEEAPAPSPVSTAPGLTDPAQASEPVDATTATSAPDETLTKQLQALQQQFEALLHTYRQDLQTIETDYATALAQAATHPHPMRQLRRLYAQARRKQQAAYRKAQRQWEQLYADYRKMLVGYQETRMVP